MNVLYEDDTTSEQYLIAAMREEAILADLMIGDPYRSMARKNIEYYLQCAVLAEQRELASNSAN